MYKLLAVSTIPSINIGDYIQALAASQYYPHIDGFVERERLDECGDSCKIIMNGWYMHQPEHWPPSQVIQPLYVAFHLNKLAQKELLTPKSITYFKEHQPIGCRDMHTVQLLRQHNVKAYFTGCLTLTLGRTYHSSQKDGKIYIVDPCLSFAGRVEMMKEFFLGMFHFSKILLLFRRLPQKWSSFGKLAYCAKFYRIYSRLFADDLLLQAEWITHESTHYKDDFIDNAARLAEAERLVKQYAKATCIITSRIHCALPCLGLDTPVLFVNDCLQDEVSTCRFEGLLSLFNVVTYNGKEVKSTFDLPKDEKISLGNLPNKKGTWHSIAEQLAKRCVDFCKE